MHAYLFRKIDSLLMLRAAMRLPWLIAKCCRVRVRAGVRLSVCAGDWQSPYRLRAGCRKQSTGIILHSRPKHLNTQCSNSPKSDKAEADIGTSMRAHTHTHTLAHTLVGLTPTGEKNPAGSPDMQPFTFPRRDNPPPRSSSPSPPVGEALMLVLKGSTYIPNLQAT